MRTCPEQSRRDTRSWRSRSPSGPTFHCRRSCPTSPGYGTGAPRARTMGASQLAKTTAIKKHYRGLGRAVGRSQIQADLYFKKLQLNNVARPCHGPDGCSPVPLDLTSQLCLRTHFFAFPAPTVRPLWHHRIWKSSVNRGVLNLEEFRTHTKFA